MNPRLRRLQSDFQLIREVFSGHPHVSVNPVGSRLPPEKYSIEYRLRGLYLNGQQPEIRDVHQVELMLPRRYPTEQPYAVPKTPIFHPNIREYFLHCRLLVGRHDTGGCHSQDGRHDSVADL